MEIPKFHETFIPILKTLENGETIQSRELYQKVIEQYYAALEKEQLEEKTKSGDNLIINRIAWGKSYLKKGGFVEFPKRGNMPALDITWYDGLDNIHEKLNKYFLVNGLKGVSPAIEVFNVNPSKESNPKNWKTTVIYMHK